MKYFLVEGGVVLWIILFLGLVALAVFFERYFHLHRIKIDYGYFLTGIFNILEKGNLREAIEICESTPGPISQITKISIMHINENSEQLHKLLREAIIREIAKMERRIVIVSFVSRVTPLLGLFGTVIGLIELLLHFQSQGDIVRVIDVSRGLMKALVTTAGGLLVAIPCYGAFTLLEVKIDRLIDDMERASVDLVSFITRLKSVKSGSENGSVKP